MTNAEHAGGAIEQGCSGPFVHTKSMNEQVQQITAEDRATSPRPLRDWQAPRPANSSITGYYKDGNPSNDDKRSVIAQNGDAKPAEDTFTPENVLNVEKVFGSKSVK